MTTLAIQGTKKPDDDWEDVPDEWETVDGQAPKKTTPVPGPRDTPVSDQDVADFLSGKRSDLPGPLSPERAKAAEAQFVSSKPYQKHKAEAEYAKFNEDSIGSVLSALDAPSMGLAGRLGQALGVRPRAQTQKVIQQATDEHPVAHVAGAFIGPGGAESLGGRLFVGGIQGGITAAAKAGDGNAANDAGTGSLLGAGGTLLAEGVLRGGGKLVGPLMQRLARSQAIRALNPLKRDVAMLANQGIESKVADDLLSSGVMRPGSNASDIAKRVLPELEQRGAAVGASKAAIDDAARGDVVAPGDVADKLEQLADEYAGKPHPETQSIADNLRQRAALIRAKPHMSLTEAESSLKLPLDIYAEKMAKTMGTPPDKLEALAEARRLIKGANEEAANVVDPALGADFLKSKQGFGRMNAVADILERNNPRALANRNLSPSDYGFGIAAGQGYRPPASMPGEEPGEKALSGLTGMIAAALHKQVRERGNSALAHLANLGSKVADVAGTGVFTAPIQRLLTSEASNTGALNAPSSPELRNELAQSLLAKSSITPDERQFLEQWFADRRLVEQRQR